MIKNCQAEFSSSDLSNRQGQSFYFLTWHFLHLGTLDTVWSWLCLVGRSTSSFFSNLLCHISQHDPDQRFIQHQSPIPGINDNAADFFLRQRCLQNFSNVSHKG